MEKTMNSIFKKHIIAGLVATLLLLSFSAKAQVTDIAEINEQLTERPWLDHSEHDIYGYRITKVFGERPAHDRHSNLGSITTLAYLDAELLKEKYGKESPGGAIELYLTRSTESRANLKWYFVVVRGEDDKEKLMEIELDYQSSQLPGANGWWNFTLVLLPDAVDFPFFVYVNDKQSRHLSDFKFKVQNIPNK